MGGPAGRSHSTQPRSALKRPPAAAFLVLFLLVVLLVLFGREAGRIARELVEESLGDGTSVARVEVAAPARLRLIGLEAPGASADEVVVDFSLPRALAGGAAAGVRGIEVKGLRFDAESPFLGAIGAGPGAKLESVDAASVLAYFPPVVRVRDAVLLSGGEPLLKGIDATLTRVGDRLRFEVQGAEALPGGAAFSLRGELSLGEGEELARAWGEGSLRGLSVGRILRADQARFDFALAVEPLQGAAGWRASIVFTEGKGDLYGFPFSSLSGQVSGGPKGWESRGLEFASDGGGRLWVAGRLRSDLLLELSIEGEGVPARSLASWFAGDETFLEGVAGTLDGRVEIAGLPSALEARGSFESAWVRVHDAVLTQVAAEFVRAPQGAVSGRAEAAAGGGFVRFDLLSWSEQGVRGRIELDGVGAPALVRAARAYGAQVAPLARLAGRVNGHMVLGGRPGALEVSWNLESSRLRWGGIPLEPVEVEGRWSAGEWEIQRASALGGDEGPLATGEASGRNGDAQVSLQLRDVPVDWLRELSGLPLLPGLSGTAGGALIVAKDGEAIRLSGEAQVRGEAMGQPVEGDAVGSIAFGGEWWVRGEIRAGGGRARLDGSGSASGAAQLEGSLERFPAEVATALWGAASLEGVVDGSAMWRREAIEAPWSLDARLASAGLDAGGVRLGWAELSVGLRGRSPAARAGGGCASCLSGTATLTADLQLPGAARAERVSLSARFLDDRAELAPASLNLWGGSAALEGSARFEGGEWRLNLVSSGEKIAFRSGGISAGLGYRLELAGPLSSLQLSGEVDVAEASLDLFGLGRRPAAAKELPVGLDIAVRLRNLRVQARSLLDGELAGELALRGSASRPALQGELAVLRGNFWYLGSHFEAGEGTVTFPGTGLTPAISVTGELRKPGTTVYARVEGPVESLQIALSSDPPLEERELLALIGVPGQWSLDEEEGWAGLGRALAAWVDRELVSGVGWRLGAVLERALDLDRFRIEPGEESAARLVLGKYVAPGLYVTYDRELSSGSSGGVGIEYTLTPRLRLRSSWSPGGGTEAGIAASLSF